MKTVYYVIRRRSVNRYAGRGGWVSTAQIATHYFTVVDVAREFSAVEERNGGASFPLQIVRIEETPGNSVEARRRLEEGEAVQDGETVKYAVHVPGCGLLAAKNKSGGEWGFEDSLDSALLFDSAGSATDNILSRKVREAWPFGGAFVTRIAITTTTTEPLITETVLQ